MNWYDRIINQKRENKIEFSHRFIIYYMSVIGKRRKKK